MTARQMKRRRDLLYHLNDPESCPDFDKSARRKFMIYK